MSRFRRRSMPVALAALCCLAVAACGSSQGLTNASSSPTGSGTGTSGMNMTGTASTGTGSMAGMSQGAVAGVKPVPTQTLATADWQGMKITARAMTPVKFLVFDGTKERMINPPKNVSFHLMVFLSDAHTGVAIPYAGVWETIRHNGKIISDERTWPMISEYMGPHYGIDVALPGKGTYQLSLLVSPPVSARHVEYQHVWLKPHRVNVSFKWNPVS